MAYKRQILLTSLEAKYDLRDQKWYMWYMWKWVATLDFQNFANECCNRDLHIVVVKEIRARIGFGWRFRKAWLNIIKSSALYQSVTLRLPLVKGKVCIVDHSHHMCPNALSHITMRVAKWHGSNGLDGIQWDGL